MEAGDPRLLALDWILHRDGMQLVSDDVNLYQRFVLAVFAYSLDSFAWYSCGKLGENFTVNIEEDVEKFPENVCPVWNPYINRTETFGVWLSSTPECTWFGITCSDDGVVKGIELMYNDLIGQIPHELFALDFLTYLALPGNCLYGTIPPEIGNLRHLLSLEIHSNGLSSSIPSEIYELDQLQLLNLAEQYGVERKCTKSNGAIVNIYFKMGESYISSSDLILRFFSTTHSASYYLIRLCRRNERVRSQFWTYREIGLKDQRMEVHERIALV
mmetsp:Transcript_7515/g.15005  ORF Transcript_7515/g.15005 Transcript_7515/m.15005 type:complete len:272 (+) Transcript_7515:2989-3804(+)